jgi:hypothetical protein
MISNLEESEVRAVKERASNIRGGVAFFSLLFACVLALLLNQLASRPFLQGGDMHRVRSPSQWIVFTPVVAHLLLGAASLWFSPRRSMTPILVGGLLCFLPVVGVAFMMYFSMGVIAAAILVLPWLFLFSLLRQGFSLTVSLTEETSHHP